jgi:hypothetical protein
MRIYRVLTILPSPIFDAASNIGLSAFRATSQIEMPPKRPASTTIRKIAKRRRRNQKTKTMVETNLSLGAVDEQDACNHRVVQRHGLHGAENSICRRFLSNRRLMGE